MNARFALVTDGRRLEPWETACAHALERAGCTIVAEDAPADIALAFDEPLAQRARQRGATETWSLCFGGPGTPIAVHELWAGEGAIFAALVRHDPGGVTPLEQGWFPVTAHSIAATADAARFGAAPWPARVMALRDKGLDAPAQPLDRPAAPSGVPSRGALAVRLGLAAVSARLAYLFRHEHWNIGVANRSIETFVDRPDTGDVRWFAPPSRGSFVADPFGCIAAGTPYLFCEGYDYREKTGYLAAGRIDDERTTVAPFMRLPVHLSYPYIVEDGGDIYCAPEMSAAGEIALYKATRLPDTWQRVATLVEGFGGCDPTIVRFADRWWMFCTHRDAPNHELHVFHADALLGPWQPHARNPVKTDVRSARPAGTPFVRDGALHRPAQDCAGGYGRRVVLNRVHALTPTEFVEEPVGYVAPDPRGPWPDGLHTLSAVGGMTLVDGKRFRFSSAQFWPVLHGYATRLTGGGRA